MTARRRPPTRVWRGGGVSCEKRFGVGAHDGAARRPFIHVGTDRSGGAPAVDARVRRRRRPPCRDFGRDPRSRELALQMRDRAARISTLLHQQLTDIAEFDRAEAWRGDGAGSMTVWVTEQCGVSASTARQWVRAAKDLAELPALSDSLASGRDVARQGGAAGGGGNTRDGSGDLFGRRPLDGEASPRARRVAQGDGGGAGRFSRPGVRAPYPALQRCPADDVGWFHPRRVRVGEVGFGGASVGR